MPDAKLHLNLLRLDERERAELLQRMEPAGRRIGRCLDHDRRREPRWIFQRSDVVAELEQPGGTTIRFLVLGRNLSANGLAFIHGGFVHPKTRGQFLLPRVDGPSQLVRGVIVGCRHVEGALHEVRVQFDRRIDPRDFLSFDELAEGLPGDSISVRDLRGQVLLVTSDTTLSKIVTHALSPTHIDVSVASAMSDARRMLSRDRCDAVVVDLDGDRDRAKRQIEELRRADHGAPIIATTGETQRQFLTEIMWEGADHVLRKPIGAHELYDVLLHLHNQRRSFVTAKSPRQDDAA